ncbi:MAG TPA: 3-dehydroquinate dehydratase [Firmicutes bacterium]|jgi:ABC-2 type transport system ATP-binding protein|nr:3-dehydroquinate dehydratase [Bacillota bacterium]HBE06128.1 3-dehydroquinate dehydratase [Bacillota bacterium]HBG43241.1 3-dehydroquinate dehydratase [Bacillota bacterium]HBL48634.1 3-dehydroquinate dehydratase [Bacillota bacterium]HBL67676.1 3-dehydroquinate dehydratase [Bacillota bacterium]
MLEINGLSKSYADSKVKAVDNLNLSVKPGEIFGFLGPNGAGKTTTIKLVVGLLNPDSGTIKINGFDNQTVTLEAKKQIGYVPDNPDLYDRLTGLEYLNFIADVYEVNENVRRTNITRYLEMFELTGAVKDLIKSYSHGMKQKLALTSALLHEPNVLILDEPMVGLDPKSAHLFKEVLRDHCDKGKAVFFSTHILDVAERLCDRVGIISHGKLIACGTLDQLRKGDSKETLEQIFLELTES